MPAVTKIETLRHPRHAHVLWCVVHDGDGNHGVGETTPRPTAARRVIHDTLAPLLLGREAANIEQFWHDAFRALHYHGYAGSELRALSAIDTALWDLAAKRAGLPLHAMLGGLCRDRVPVYNTCVSHGPTRDYEAWHENPAQLARDLIDDGFTAMKVWPFDDLAPRTRGQDISQRDLEKGTRLFAEVRDAVGDDIEIALEGHCCWNLPAAVKIARATEPYRPIWLEDLTPADNAHALRQLKESTSTPLCVSERLFTRHQYRPVLEAGAVDVVMPDLCWVGGVSETLKIAHLAGVYGLPVAPHNCGGPVQTLCYAHVAGHLDNLMICESVRAFVRHFHGEVVREPAVIEGGHLLIPDRPGIGVEFAEGFRDRCDVEVSEGGAGPRHWHGGDPWADDLGDQF